MAEIPIQRRERRSWWPWVLLVLVVLAVAWYFMTRTTGVASAVRADSTAVLAPTAPNSTIAADSAAANRVAAPPTRTDSPTVRP